MKRRELLKFLAATSWGGVLVNTLGGRAGEADSGAIASPSPARTAPVGDAFEDKTDWLQSLLDRGEGFVRFPDGRFQEGLRHIGRVTIQNVVRTDEPDALNDVPTIDVHRDVHIASLVIRDVVQRVPGKKKPPVVIHPEARIWNLKTDGVLTLD